MGILFFQDLCVRRELYCAYSILDINEPLFLFHLYRHNAGKPSGGVGENANLTST